MDLVAWCGELTRMELDLLILVGVSVFFNFVLLFHLVKGMRVVSDILQMMAKVKSKPKSSSELANMADMLRDSFREHASQLGEITIAAMSHMESVAESSQKNMVKMMTILTEDPVSSSELRNTLSDEEE